MMGNVPAQLLFITSQNQVIIHQSMWFRLALGDASPKIGGGPIFPSFEGLNFWEFTF